MESRKELPKFKRGQGSMFYSGGRIRFQKTLLLLSGEKKRCLVVGDTVDECLTEMKEKEIQLNGINQELFTTSTENSENTLTIEANMEVSQEKRPPLPTMEYGQSCLFYEGDMIA